MLGIIDIIVKFNCVCGSIKVVSVEVWINFVVIVVKCVYVIFNIVSKLMLYIGVEYVCF